MSLEDNWTEQHPKQLFLLQIEPSDWIVHINTPDRDKCIVAKMKSSYKFEDGLECSGRIDFRHNFALDTNSIIEFDRKDPNILPTVNLKPRQRYHRIYAVDDFLESIDNLNGKKVNLKGNETREEYHLKDKIEASCLKEMITLVQEMNQSKQLEIYLSKVFIEKHKESYMYTRMALGGEQTMGLI